MLLWRSQFGIAAHGRHQTHIELLTLKVLHCTNLPHICMLCSCSSLKFVLQQTYNHFLSPYQNVFQVFLLELAVHPKGVLDFVHLSGHKNRTTLAGLHETDVVLVITEFDQTQTYAWDYLLWKWKIAWVFILGETKYWADTHSIKAACGSCGAGVSNLALAAGWLVISQQPTLLSEKEQWSVEGEQRRRRAVCWEIKRVNEQNLVGVGDSLVL